MRRIIRLTLIITLLISSCGIPEEEFSKTTKQLEQSEIERKKFADRIQSLEKQLDECKFGAEKLLRTAQNFFKNEQYEECNKEIRLLLKKHPKSSEAEKALALILKSEAEIERLTKLEEQDEEKRRSEERRNIAIATKKMRKSYDKLEGITWYRDKTSPVHTNKNGFFLYIGDRGYNNPWLHLRIQYKGDDWLFIEKYHIYVDGFKYSIEPEYGEIEKDNGYSAVWEWLDITADEEELKIVKAVSEGINVKIRFIGQQYSKDITITKSQKQAIKNVLYAFKAIEGE